ncbi:acetate--CoA ligase [Phaeobacter gallaeciensis]|uniref:acetate--CoA ligase n=1 Tax=Phaeobacter gallaeciensis TaxID=60890 RepID=UPI00237F1AA1|nr:acetate--CoA ligase [Phaeobacter gallaeciensis]MDE4305025.1 acetate--CoA ligase [Phaeobacter gallaeciensis]MDE4309373.1 acetate--CoA ligase [Phaeobacter gallaeciensis]MDE4313830.1 acetate--CoA ligase [Phaeobacter gallaeciensis]MDE4318192.1 acetate--CoA ligase [Phaeobacter gallaeciensis]MDE4323316.1 acetate--CoA ligase [Phaeobacter gallaeciensis]
MATAPITKPDSVRAAANMTDYDTLCAGFSWNDAQALIDGLPDGRMNIAHEAVDRHVDAGHGEQLALRWISKSGSQQDFTYAALQTETNRFANMLRSQGLQKGDRVYALLGRVPELYIAALGTLKAGCTFCPLFSAFGPEPIRSRMEIGGANALITTARLYKRKVKALRPDLPDLRKVFVIDEPAEDTLPLTDLMADASEEFTTEAMNPEDTALLHFTSGTTGKPKGVVHVHQAVVAHNWTGRIALDLRAGDTYWCTADPGWVTGTSYGIVAPLTNRVSMIVDEAEFDVARWYEILEGEGVNVWYTAPTAIRMLMKAGTEALQGRDFSDLRFMASVGEPLNPEAVIWGNAAFGQPFHDNWWQTETGGIMIANYAAMDVKPGSMGRPLPGIEAGIVEMDPEGDSLRALTEPQAMGELALRPGWPSMMRGYLHEQARYDKCFRDGWYLTGDLAMRDADGYFWFVGRADDLIKSAGHLIGPFEVESALMEHEAVAEVGVIGIPDETAGELVKAYVALKPGYEPDEDLRLDLLGHARKRLGPAVAPKEIAFRKNLPKTRSGKIMRRLLKARELGLPEGDISTLESDET